LVVPDLGADKRFQDRPFVSSWPHNRFYAGCPIRTNRGVDIGILCVFDEQPRPEGLSSAHFEVMIDVSGAIMTMLESNRAQRESRRNERMVRGIGSFVEGSSTLAGWWQNIDTTSFQAQPDGEGLLDAAQQDLAKQAEVNPLTGRETSAPEDVKAPLHSRTPQTKSESELMLGISHHDHVVVAQPLPAHISPQDAHGRAVQTAFAKAANIIRESLEVEGVMFLDGRISTFGGMVERKSRDTTSSPSGDSDVTKYLSSTSKSSKELGQPKPEDDPLSKVLAFSNSDNSTINRSAIGGHYALTESSLRTFIRRYPLGTIFNFDKLGGLESSESDGSTTASVTSYPSSPIEPKVAAPYKKKGKRRSKINDASIVLKLLPGARSAIFFPLWDSDHQRWFAGAVVWSSRPRSFTARGELSYLAAFGNTIMSQIARLDALVIDKAKTDLLGSISHELRSPLHGVLGGVEMLADTDIDSFQNDVLHTIETCGKTLLDTMDHLLDFTKINNFSSTGGRLAATKRRRRKRGEAVERDSYTLESGMRNLFSNTELDILVEEVVESVYAGQQFAGKREESPPLRPVGGKGSKQQARMAEVAVILELDYAAKNGSRDDGGSEVKDWRFNVVPGGLRRILMNIFGNALKYTEHGSVRVSLSSSPTQHHRDDAQLLETSTDDSAPLIEEVVLRVTDTGRGISTNFLDHQMFLPFTQEDRLNPGTGLGLSIAHQIVGNLNGTIRVRSDVGHGTEFTITLPLPRTHRPRSRESSYSTTKSGTKEPEDNIKAAKGLRIALIGFSGSSDKIDGTESDKTTTPIRGPIRRRASYEAETAYWTLPRAEIENICRTKLGMEVLPSPQNLTQLADMVPRPELLLTSERHLAQLVTDLEDLQGLSSDHVVPPIVAVCANIAIARERARRKRVGSAVVDFISQPCGPRKLANAFALSLLRWAEEREADSVADASPALVDSEGCVKPMQELPPSEVELAQRPGSSFRELLEPAQSTDPAPGKRDRFLLVEDNQINLRILVSFVKKKQLEHDTAENGLVALESYREKHASYRFIFMGTLSTLPRLALQLHTLTLPGHRYLHASDDWSGSQPRDPRFRKGA
jgi:signal transduction histidine kinase